MFNKFVDELEGFSVGQVVRIHGIDQKLTITHLEPKWFRDHLCQLIYQKSNKNMSTLSNVPLKTIRKCNE